MSYFISSVGSCLFTHEVLLLKQSETLLGWQEKRLCSEIRLTPPLYLRMEEVLSVEIFNGNVTKKSDAHHLFKIDPSKIDRIYEMLIKKGIAQP